MTAATAAAPLIWKGSIDSFTLGLMREAKEVRDANPGDPSDAALDALLAAAEAAYAAGQRDSGYRDAEDVQTIQRRGDAVASGARTSWGQPSASGPSEAQERFIRSMAATLGWNDNALRVALEGATTKPKASRLIDAMKVAVADARRNGTAAAPAARPERKATERQVEYVADLLLNRAHGYPSDLDLDGLTFERASALITELRDAPRAKVAAHGIREGRYAYSADGGQTADHYRVSRTGKITVWTAGGEYPYTGKGLTPALEWIKENQRDAAALFGRLTETCGRCGRDLSNDESRAIGLGPVCAEKGW